MKKSKVIILILTVTIFFTGCNILPQKEQTKTDNPTLETVVTPKLTVSEQYHQGILPYKENVARGYFSGGMNTEHLEFSMFEVARVNFPIEQFVFQEGQIITKDYLKSIRTDQFLKIVLEHEYLAKNSLELAGIVVGVGVVTSVKQNDKELTLSNEELEKKGKSIIKYLTEEIRKKTNVPILFLVMKIDPKTPIIPGSIIGQTTILQDENKIKEWQAINEAFNLFPNLNLALNDSAYSSNVDFNNLKKELETFFPEYISITGLGRFRDNQLVELTINVTAKFSSKSEVVQFTQYAASLINKYINKQVHVNLYVQLIDKPLAVYVRPSNGAEYMHIYR